jgi:hypothetical protein
MESRMTMVLRIVLIATLVLGGGWVAGVELNAASPSGAPEPEAAVLPWSFGGVWEMDLRCADAAAGKHNTHATVVDGLGAAGQDRAVEDLRIALAGRMAGPQARVTGSPPPTPPETPVAATPRGGAAGHHDGAIAAGTRYTLDASPPRNGSGTRALVRATDESAPLERGWSRAQLAVAGSVPLDQEIPCAATADEYIAFIQQQDLLRLEGNVCLSGGSSTCHDHFVVIVARRAGTLGRDDDGQLVIFAMDAGGQYTTGRRIRSLQDAAAYGGALKRHLGNSHSHETGAEG